MSDGESRLVLGHRPGAVRLVEQSEGWPAVIGLAAGVDQVEVPNDALPAALHDFFAEELFRSASPALQAQLIRLALSGDRQRITTPEDVQGEPGRSSSNARVGFPVHGWIGWRTSAHSRVPASEALGRPNPRGDRPRWGRRLRRGRGLGRAFELILRFGLMDLVESTLEASYKPLLRSGRLETLSSFAASVRIAPTFPPPIVDLVEADAAFRNGAYALAAAIARRVRRHFRTIIRCVQKRTRSSAKAPTSMPTWRGLRRRTDWRMKPLPMTMIAQTRCTGGC